MLELHSQLLKSSLRSGPKSSHHLQPGPDRFFPVIIAWPVKALKRLNTRAGLGRLQAVRPVGAVQQRGGAEGVRAHCHHIPAGVSTQVQVCGLRHRREGDVLDASKCCAATHGCCMRLRGSSCDHSIICYGGWKWRDEVSTAYFGTCLSIDSCVNVAQRL